MCMRACTIVQMDPNVQLNCLIMTKANKARRLTLTVRAAERSRDEQAGEVRDRSDLPSQGKVSDSGLATSASWPSGK